MFNFIKKLFRGKPNVESSTFEERDEDYFPHISFTLLPDGRVAAECYWPAPENDAEYLHLTGKFASLVFLLNQGKFFHICQQAIAGAGQRDDAENVSQQILNILNVAREQETVRDVASKMVPCVTPVEAFNPRPEGISHND